MKEKDATNWLFNMTRHKKRKIDDETHVEGHEEFHSCRQFARLREFFRLPNSSLYIFISLNSIFLISINFYHDI